MGLILHKQSVLLIEDNEALQKIESWILQELGYLTEVVGNAHEALKFFSSKCFDAVVTDIELPDMNGEQLIQWLRAMEVSSSEKRVPILVITAYMSKEVIKGCIRAGADVVLEKPLNKEVLKMELYRLLYQQKRV